MNKDRFWTGQVPPYQDNNKSDPNTWGSRVKVRIVGVHPQSGAITPDSHLDYAMVPHPTSQGSFSRGSTGIIGGELVYGMYLNKEGDEWKDPIILGVLPRTLGVFDITAEEAQQNSSTEFKRIQPFWGDIQPQSWQIQGGPPPESQEPTVPTPAAFGLGPDSEAATAEAAEPITINVNNLPTGWSVDSTGAVVNPGNQIIDFPDENGNITL